MTAEEEESACAGRRCWRGPRRDDRLTRPLSRPRAALCAWRWRNRAGDWCPDPSTCCLCLDWACFNIFSLRLLYNTPPQLGRVVVELVEVARPATGRVPDPPTSPVKQRRVPSPSTFFLKFPQIQVNTYTTVQNKNSQYKLKYTLNSSLFLLCFPPGWLLSSLPWVLDSAAFFVSGGWSAGFCRFI